MNTLPIILLALALTLPVGAAVIEQSTHRQVTQASAGGDVRHKEALTDFEAIRVVRQLWDGLPDHGINDNTREALSSSFYALVQEGFDMPGTEPEGIGEEEVMWYWYTGQDTCGDEKIVKVRVKSNTPDGIHATATYKTCGGVEDYDVWLIYEDGRWVINDFDNMRKPIQEFVTTWRSKFASGEHERMMRDETYSYLLASEKREYIDSVESYLKKYNVKPIVVREVKESPPAANDNQIYQVVEKPAEFPGGQAALYKWLSQNMKYPQEAQQNGVQGRVYVIFVVEKDGSITDVKISKGVYSDLDAEAVRVVRKMPKWVPAKNNGVAVRCYITLPITFKLT